jgi:antitoxin component of MazEF toxin-antitoxin module
VRHPLVAKIVKAYETYELKEAGNTRTSKNLHTNRDNGKNKKMRD